MLKEQTYWTRRLDNSTGNSKQLWRCFNTILLRDDVSNYRYTSLTAQNLSVFLQDKIAKVRAVTQLCPPPPASFTEPCLSNFLEFQPCTINDIRRVILQLPAKSSALDPIHHSLLISLFDHIMFMLHLICNNSLREGSLPDCEKLAFITPILKKPGLD